MITLSAPDILDSDGRSTGVADLTLTEDGRSIALVDGLEALRQRVTQRLRFFLHEWFLDHEAGVPYLQGIFRTAVPVGLASTIIIDQVLAVDGVARVTEVVADLDPNSRRLNWSARVHASAGGSVEVNVEI